MSLIGWQQPIDQAVPTTTTQATELERQGWQAWLTTLFPSYVTAGFSERHAAFWDWVWAMESKVRPAPLIAVWPRGGGKSTSAELAAVALGARGVRKYVWYISETQEQADNHVQTIAGLLESSSISTYYPAMGDRLLGKFGNSKGWRRNRLRTASGFIVDALGLDKAARGGKLDDQRPDMLIIDDVDSEGDSTEAVDKKIATLTRKLLPAGLSHTAVLGVQNLVHENSIFSQLVNGEADFVGDRIVSGPFPALTGLIIDGDGKDARIIAGEPTWQGQDQAACQSYITTWGLEAFLSECQHKAVIQKDRFLPSIIWWDNCLDPDLPPLTKHEALVLALDAGEVSDTFAAVAVGRHPLRYDDAVVRYSRVWIPVPGVPLDFQAIEDELRAFVRQYNVLQLCFDRYQLRQMTQRLSDVVWCQEFSQAGDRLVADKYLLDTIRDRHIAWDKTGMWETLREHLDNADRKVESQDRLRIVKRTASRKIDLSVSLSMALYRMMTEFQ